MAIKPEWENGTVTVGKWKEKKQGKRQETIFESDQWAITMFLLHSQSGGKSWREKSREFNILHTPS